MQSIRRDLPILLTTHDREIHLEKNGENGDPDSMPDDARKRGHDADEGQDFDSVLRDDDVQLEGKLRDGLEHHFGEKQRRRVFCVTAPFVEIGRRSLRRRGLIQVLL